MAGYENIRDANDKRTPEERRELAKKAGKASGQARRRKADFRKTLNLLLTAEIDNEEWKPVLESLGIECTLESALLMAQIKMALAGDTQAAKFVAQYSGQSARAEEDLENKKADGVHVHVDHKTAVTDNGLKSAEVYKIRIPADIPEAGQYLPPDQFACCGGYGYWTIQNDDQIVLGECQIEIEKPADLKAVFQKHCKVTSWSDNRFGTVPHWRIGGE